MAMIGVGLIQPAAAFRSTARNRMERQYIWFRTGVGFAVAAIGISVATIVALVVMLNTPADPRVQFPLVFAVYAIGILPAFLVERSRVARRRARRSGVERISE